VREGQPGGVEELAREAQVAGDAVDGVTRDGQPDGLEVDADLMGAPRLEADVEQCVAGQELGDLEVRHRVARGLGVERHAGRLAPVAADRRLDPPPPRTRKAADEGEVLPLDRPLAEQALQPSMSLLRPCDDEQARRVAIESVDDAGPVRVVSAGRTSPQALHERAPAAPRSRVDDDAGGLVDDEQVLVLEGDSQRDVLALERLRRGLRLELDVLSTGQPVALRPGRPVDRDLTRVDQALGSGPGADLGQRGEEPVEPGSRGVVRDVQADGQDDPRP
jgi:hypothetical protein